MADFLAYKLGPIVFNMSLTASVIIAFVLLARLLLKNAPKVFSYALWAVVLLRLLCPVSVTAGFSLLGLLDTPVREMTQGTSAVEYVPPNIVHIEIPQVKLPVPGISKFVNETLPQGQEQLVADPLEAAVSIATCIWLAGILSMLLYSILSLLRLCRKLTDAVPIQGNIYIADRIGAPFVMGLLRPRIYLPSSLPEREQAYIILHEQYHIRRLDHIVKIITFAALCIHWFNPLVWLAFVLSGKDMEMSCDEAVVKKLGAGIRADYSASLLRFFNIINRNQSTLILHFHYPFNLVSIPLVIQIIAFHHHTFNKNRKEATLSQSIIAALKSSAGETANPQLRRRLTGREQPSQTNMTASLTTTPARAA